MDWDEEGGRAIPWGRKQGATHEKVIKQDAHHWMPQAGESKGRDEYALKTRGSVCTQDVWEMFLSALDEIV